MYIKYFAFFFRDQKTGFGDEIGLEIPSNNLIPGSPEHIVGMPGFS
jgi:hypothetical protein